MAKNYTRLNTSSTQDAMNRKETACEEEVRLLSDSDSESQHTLMSPIIEKQPPANEVRLPSDSDFEYQHTLCSPRIEEIRLRTRYDNSLVLTVKNNICRTNVLKFIL